MQKDNVNHPSHYTQGGIECIDAIKAATVGLTGIEAVCTGNAVKYMWRWKFKNGAEDIRKAMWYLEKLLAEVESENSNRRRCRSVQLLGTVLEHNEQEAQNRLYRKPIQRVQHL